MTKSVVARWDAGLAFEATSGLGGEVAMSGDQGAAAYRPSELLLAALAGCTGMDVISILHKKRQFPATYEVEVVGSQQMGQPAIFTHVTVEHVFGGEGLDQSALHRAIELSATRYCPVTAQLSAGDLRISHRYRSAATPGGAEVVITGPHGAGLAPSPE